MALASGTRLGPYEIVAPLGAGGMGEVYRAKDPRLNREVAIKVLPEHLSKDPEALARFEREAQSVAALSHPNILAIHDFGSEQDICFAVTELLEGETLRGRLSGAALPWRKAVDVAVAVADGLSAAHAKGIIHRDLKPENIFLTSDGRVKILDFGLARWKPSASDGGESSAPTETDEGTVLGTVGYMSPEQVRGIRAEAPSDIFSLGCVLYEMVAGRRAFRGQTAGDTLAAILKEQPPELASSGKTIPPELDRVITRCLEKNVEERFQSARDLAFALKEVAESRAALVPALGRLRWRRSAIWIAALVLLAAISLYWAMGRRKAIDSLAVLPFANAGADPNAEYLSDGITENLINSLSRVPRLRVMSWSKVARFKAKDADPQTVGRDLKVRAVLTGRVVQRGEILTIRADLVDAEDGSQLWGEQYNRKLADILVVQAEISREISEKLRLQLSSEERNRLAAVHPVNPDAFQLYLQGRFYWNKRTETGIRKSLEYFEKAIVTDPGYPLAYAGLADAYSTLLSRFEALPPAEAYPKARMAATKALQLDETLAEAHSSLAGVRTFYEWDFPGAEKEFKRAIELKPGYASAHHYYSHYLIAMRRIEESLAESRRALEIDRLDIPVNNHLGWHYLFAHQYDLAIEQLRKTIDLDANFYAAHLYLGFSLEQKGGFPQAIAEFQKASKLDEAPEPIASLGHAYAVSGRRAEAQKALVELNQRSNHRYVSPYFVALIYAGLGDNDQAFAWLEKAYEGRATKLIELNGEARFDPLRGDPRFTALLRRVGIPP